MDPVEEIHLLVGEASTSGDNTSRLLEIASRLCDMIREADARDPNAEERLSVIA